ncbi:MAG: lipid-A-disaccharide synthase [Nitrospira sp.]|nr:lipid-A-disaccharide synthase [bacterium]MBL7048971.1 lipid-A-disaccharide synthase [Nitrospira sp.]
MSKKLMISAGETSGEIYGALMSRQIKKMWPDIKILGIGGSHMKEEGIELIAPITHVVGIFEVVRHLPKLWDTYQRAKAALKSEKPDLLVLIDYPDFNLVLAKAAHAAGIPILYYVSPQVWAWRKGRIHKIAARVSKMAVLFPFEVQYYERVGLPCEFVGHPITETLNITESKEELKLSLGLDPKKDLVALLPGSRPGEISRHIEIVKETAAKLHNKYPSLQIAVALAAGTSLDIVMPEYIKVIAGKTTKLVAAAKAAAVASGTATLETAILGTPMVVYYNIPPLTYHLGKLLVDVEFISLANLLSDKQVVQEYVQNEANADNIFQELDRILDNDMYRTEMITNLLLIKKSMKTEHPSARVAAIAGELADWGSPAE